MVGARGQAPHWPQAQPRIMEQQGGQQDEQQPAPLHLAPELLVNSLARLRLPPPAAGAPQHCRKAGHSSAFPRPVLCRGPKRATRNSPRPATAAATKMSRPPSARPPRQLQRWWRRQQSVPMATSGAQWWRWRRAIGSRARCVCGRMHAALHTSAAQLWMGRPGDGGTLDPRTSGPRSYATLTHRSKKPSTSTAPCCGAAPWWPAATHATGTAAPRCCCCDPPRLPT